MLDADVIELYGVIFFFFFSFFPGPCLCTGRWLMCWKRKQTNWYSCFPLTVDSSEKKELWAKTVALWLGGFCCWCLMSNLKHIFYNVWDVKGVCVCVCVSVCLCVCVVVPEVGDAWTMTVQCNKLEAVSQSCSLFCKVFVIVMFWLWLSQAFYDGSSGMCVLCGFVHSLCVHPISLHLVDRCFGVRSFWV